MKDDLISKTAAIDAVHKSILDFFDICDDDEESPMTYKDERLLEVNKVITTRIKAVPSAEPKIIRCVDCKYMTEHYDTDGNAPYWTCSEWDSGTDYDGFCHYAERREE